MIVVSLISLLVYLFGAYAYAVTTILCASQISPVWGRHFTGTARERMVQAGAGLRDRLARRGRWQLSPRIDIASLTLFALSTVWFVLHVLIEFRNLTGQQKEGWLDLATLIVYLFPPAIMHTVYLERGGDGVSPPPRIYGWLVAAMYVIAPAVGLYSIAAIFQLVSVPGQVGPWIGGSIGALFTLCSLYCTTIMLRHRKRQIPVNQARLRNVMVFLFAALTLMFLAMIVLPDSQLIMEVVGRLSRFSPLYFLIAAVYFENRFEFYDLVIKRAVLLLLSVISLGVFLALTLPWLERLPGGSARPWLFAVALAPIAMVMPWLYTRFERWLDRMWLGREYTPVEAVKHVLAAMQPATDEQSLIRATEARLSEIFGARISVLIGDQAAPGGIAIENEVAMASPVGAQPVRIAVLRVPGTRRVLSEDLALMRSLAGVFGFMLENIRLQRKRLEQDQIAQELRLQTSRSELKALRAQINPHFLFNALNAIASLIHTDPGRADEAVEQLAEVFRYTLRRSESEWAPLDQELAFARAYLDVEQARFGQRLTYSIDSDHLPPPPHVPSMLLQTLLENAVKHGVSQAREPGRIEVRVRTSSSEVIVEVRNTGPGSDASHAGSREGEGFGLHSVRERLKGHFGDRASFSLVRDESAGMTVARIAMPHVRMAA